MEVEVQEAERPQLALPVVAVPARSHARTRRTAARASAVTWAERRAWASGWDHPLRIAIKGLLLTLLVALGIVLAGYAGVLPLLPAAPPRMEVAGAAQRARIAPWAYCWLSSGAGGCVDGALATGQSSSAALAVAPGQAVPLRFGYPVPTSCAATGALAPASSAPLTIRADPSGAWSSGYALAAPSASGVYAVSIICDWNPHRSLRWLRGFGHATYALTLRVGAN